MVPPPAASLVAKLGRGVRGEDGCGPWGLGAGSGFGGLGSGAAEKLSPQSAQQRVSMQSASLRPGNGAGVPPPAPHG